MHIIYIWTSFDRSYKLQGLKDMLKTSFILQLKQNIVQVVCETIWLCHILDGLGVPQKKSMVLYCNNQNVVKLVCNPMFHEHMKHIEVDCHFIHQHVQQHKSQLQFCQVVAFSYKNMFNNLKVITSILFHSPNL